MKKRRYKKENKSSVGSVVTILVLAALISGAGLGYYGYRYTNSNLKNSPELKELNLKEYVPGENEAVIKVPALDEEGNGVSTDLVVKVEPGTGKTLVDINTLLFWVDTQNSIRMAKIVAEDYTGINLGNYDVTYDVNADASLIGGESAGAALAIATIAALQDDKLKNDVMITGAINHDGSIGPIGGIIEKAQAAKEAGASTFLVPLLQGTEIIYEEKKHCETFGLMEWCNVERIPQKVNVGDESGIDIVEVGSIQDAYKYFMIS